jgi:hypothetical protein
MKVMSPVNSHGIDLWREVSDNLWYPPLLAGEIRQSMSVFRGCRTMFVLGDIVATRGALDAIKASGENPMTFIVRHVQLDQGNLPDEDHELNKEAILNGNRVFSSFSTEAGDDIWVITEADRSSTCLLLKEEY